MNWDNANDILLYWQNEDELPYIPDEVYKAMFLASRVDFVRLFPYIKIDNKKYFLIELEEE